MTFSGCPPAGIWLFPESPAEKLVDTFAEAEALGLDEVWIGDEGPAFRDPFAVLAAAAVRTRRIRLGVAVTNPYLRHPAVTASAMMTVAELSAGRGILGLGAGGGIALDPVGIPRIQPLRRTKEALRIARAVAGGQQVHGYDPPSHPFTRPSLPVYIGGRGEKINRYGSEEADGVFLGGIPFAGLDAAVAWARSVRPVDVALYPSVIFNDEDLDWARPRFIFAFLDTPGSTRELARLAVDDIRRAVQAFEDGDEAPARTLITDEVLRQLAIVGDPGRIASRLAALVRAHRPASIGVCIRTAGTQAARLPEVTEVFSRLAKELST